MTGSSSDDWIFGTLVTISLNHIYYRQYSAIADLHTLQFTNAHALGFSVSTSRLLATDLNTNCHFKSPRSLLLILSSITLYSSVLIGTQLIFTIHAPFSFLCSQLLNLPGLSTNLKSKSHCDWRTVSQSWCRAPSGAHDQIFIIVWQLRSCFYGAPSLTRGRVCQSRLSTADYAVFLVASATTAI
jgi:hypothetical protein